MFAAASLVEAACYRRTGKRVDISESYLIYLHMRSQFNALQSYNPQQKAENGNITPLDGIDDSYKNLERIYKQNQVCAANEFASNAKFVKDFKQIVKKGQEQFGDRCEAVKTKVKESCPNISEERLGEVVLDACSKQVPKEFCKKLDGVVQCSVSSEKAKGASPVSIQTKDPVLKECFKKLAEIAQLDNPSTAMMKALIDQKLPFLCEMEAEVKIPGSPMNGQIVYHSSVVYGYDDDFQIPGKGKGIVFLLRDSNSPQMGKLRVDSCQRVIYIKP